MMSLSRLLLVLLFATTASASPLSDGIQRLKVSHGLAGPPPVVSPPQPAGVVLKTDMAVYPEPPLPTMGPAGSTVIDPVFGTTILRVTDSTDASEVRVPYSQTPTFNVNTTRMYARAISPAGAMIIGFNPTTFTIGQKQIISSPSDGILDYNGQWSRVDPDVIYFPSRQRLWRYQISTKVWTQLYDFTSLVPPGGYVEQMSVGGTDNVFAFSKANAASSHIGYLVWKRTTNTILANVDDRGADECQVDPSEQWLTIQMVSGNAVIRNLATGAMVHTVWGADGFYHADTGPGTVFSADGSGTGLAVRNLTTPRTVTRILAGKFPFSNQNYSMYADNHNWALVWTQRNDAGKAAKAFENEIVQVSLDGTNQVRRIAHHRSQWKHYHDQPNANISRDGQFVAFSSNWGNSSGRRDLYVVKIPIAP